MHKLRKDKQVSLKSVSCVKLSRTCMHFDNNQLTKISAEPYKAINCL